ncbi:NAD-dependent epimerase/dehydratase family protein [Rhodococcus sp. X156]|uniref:NAD-dependent epimerase/dehydratase family protein n=1 Tax=Rhodococcus sp. X156 TaxID=2499145 RepID=UPI000FD88597|nr:NAD-dependent epimerase/dehydratase family protein [Rhodococcus sp. X156]
MSALHVITGAGPVGRTVATQLAHAGHHVRLLTRSGSGPRHENIERRAVDVHDESALRAAVDGATAVYHCAHAAYSAAAWATALPAMEQAVLRAAADSVVVFPESLYSYSEPSRPMTEDSPRAATGGKRGMRTELLRARQASATPTVSVVASDFFGPHVHTAHAGDRMVGAVLAGRTVRVMGSADQPHSFTYVPDYAGAMVAAAARPQVWGSVLHAPTGPALTQRQLVHALAEAAGVPATVRTLPSWVLRAGALVPGSLRELAEMLYQFEQPFVLDSRRSEELLGLAPTPLTQAVRETVAWWRTEQPNATGRR